MKLSFILLQQDNASDISSIEISKQFFMQRNIFYQRIAKHKDKVEVLGFNIVSQSLSGHFTELVRQMNISALK